MNKEGHIEVHLKRKIVWWDGEKLCNVRKFTGTLKTLHLEVVEGQGYVIAPFTVPDKYGRDSTEGLAFPIKESIEWIEEVKTRQAMLPKEAREEVINEFIEDYNDFCRSEDKEHWVPKKIREWLKKKK